MTDRDRLESELAELREALAECCDGAQQRRLRLAIESRERELAAATNSTSHSYPRPKYARRRR